MFRTIGSPTTTSATTTRTTIPSRKAKRRQHAIRPTKQNTIRIKRWMSRPQQHSWPTFTWLETID